MYSVRSGFVAKPHDPLNPPNITKYLGLEPMRWEESYILYGKKQGSYDLYGDDKVLKTFHEGVYKTKCKICGEYSIEQIISAEEARIEHFVHCSARHGYVFPADSLKIMPDDPELQDLITKANLYNLPMPGYDVHDNCVRMEINSKAVCVLHGLCGKWHRKDSTY